jgi:hypothetical protein
MYFPRAQLHGYLPRTWKGQVPADVMAARIQARVERAGWAERVIPPKPARRWGDVWHGIGVGLYHLDQSR